MQCGFFFYCVVSFLYFLLPCRQNKPQTNQPLHWEGGVALGQVTPSLGEHHPWVVSRLGRKTLTDLIWCWQHPSIILAMSWTKPLEKFFATIISMTDPSSAAMGCKILEGYYPEHSALTFHSRVESSAGLICMSVLALQYVYSSTPAFMDLLFFLSFFFYFLFFRFKFWSLYKRKPRKAKSQRRTLVVLLSEMSSYGKNRWSGNPRYTRTFCRLSVLICCFCANLDGD